MSDVDITVSRHLMHFIFYILFYFLHHPRFVLYNVIIRTSLALSFILSFLHVQLLVPQAVTELFCCIILLDYGLQFAVFGGQRVAAPHAPLSPVAVTLGALGLCFIVLIFKNKSVVCVLVCLCSDSVLQPFHTTL